MQTIASLRIWALQGCKDCRHCIVADLSADKQSQFQVAQSIKRWVKGMLISVGVKPSLTGGEAACVHEEVAKRIPNVRFIRRVKN